MTRTTMRLRMIAMTAALAAAAMFGCSGEVTENGSPVDLLVTSAPKFGRVDLAGGTGCSSAVADVTVRVQARNAAATGTFTQVRLQSYRVSYSRRDGGRTVPASFVRTVDTILAVGGTAALPEFIVLQGDAVSQAPFAALQPQNGGRDAETGRSIVNMDVIVEVFGETLGGDRVYDATRFPLDFCFGCGGCD